MRFAVEAWDPGYGVAVEEDALTPSDVPTELDVEVPIAAWAPRRPAVPPASSVLFVDGVQRVDTRVWVIGDDGTSHHGVCASYAAGAVRVHDDVEIVATAVRRGLFSTAAVADRIDTRFGTYSHVAVATDETAKLWRCIGQCMGDLEVEVAREARAAYPDALVVVDGPLRQHRSLRGAVGSIKTMHRSYGRLPVVLDTARDLQPGERTPLMVVGERFTSYSWYVRLPEPNGPTHPLSGLVRCEVASDIPATEAVAIADRVTVTLPRYASEPHRDRRAPQNLYPIAGLERELWHRLGDRALLYRGLLEAAA